jgi:hypothetical protein
MINTQPLPFSTRKDYLTIPNVFAWEGESRQCHLEHRRAWDTTFSMGGATAHEGRTRRAEETLGGRRALQIERAGNLWSHLLSPHADFSGLGCLSAPLAFLQHGCPGNPEIDRVLALW